MMTDTVIARLKRFHQRLNGSAVKYDLTPYFSILAEIKKHESNLKKKTDGQLKRISQDLTAQSQKDVNLDNLLVKAYALVHEAVYRVLGLSPFDVQIIGAVVMHQGDLAELQTGEGKTLSAVFPSYLNAIAGRGIDIRLGGADEKEKEEVMALDGLYVVGTNLHESPRIDRQLRGRAGRQGDPGASRFFISLEDDLFIKYRLQDFLPTHILGENQYGETDNKIVRNEIARIQEKIEGQNLEIKKTLFKYSSIIEKQREKISEERRFFLNSQNASKYFESNLPKRFYAYKSLLKHKKLNRLCKRILISSIDTYWSQYLADIGETREEIHLYSLGGQVPFFEFQKIAGKIFADLSKEFDDQVIQKFNNILIAEKDIDIELEKLKSPSATWTYTINDNPMDFALGVVGDIGLSAATGVTAPIIKLLTKLSALKGRVSEKSQPTN